MRLLKVSLVLCFLLLVPLFKPTQINFSSPEAATLPRPVDLSPAEPDSLPRASAAFPDFAAIERHQNAEKELL